MSFKGSSSSGSNVCCGVVGKGGRVVLVIWEDDYKKSVQSSKTWKKEKVRESRFFRVRCC